MIVEHRSRLPVGADEAYAWHARAGAFERLVPPWESVRLVEPHPGLEEGSRVTLEVPVGPVYTRWVARHENVRPGEGFTDVQEQGPFARWRHEHRFEPDGRFACELVDRVEVELPGGPVGELAEPCVRRRLARTLRYRHRVTAADLAMHAQYRGAPRLRVAITGASGLLGRTLAAVLTTGGHDVVRLVRRPARAPDEIAWDPVAGGLDPEALARVDAVVHLAADSIGEGRWTEAKRARIRSSRIEGTRLVAGAMARASRRPQVLVSASAIGIYGNRGEEVLTDTSPPGRGFLPEVGVAWEAATEAARAAGIRTVPARVSPVLTPAGGMLGRIYLPFSLGIGGPLGDGRQWTSWIAIDDAIGVIVHALLTDTVSGPLNVTSPEPVRNEELTAVLGRILHRPAILPVPAFALRLLFPGLADEGLLASARVVPAALIASDYVFRYPTLETALRHELGRGAP